MEDMGNGVLMEQMDQRLTDLYEEITAESRISSVYFTGEGFSDLWFGNTLRRVSETNRAFKGNNLYAKGACLSGLLRAERPGQDYNIVCSGRTKHTVSVEAKHKDETLLLNLSRAPKDWFDAGMRMDFIVSEADAIRFYVTSLIENKRSSFDIDISEIPRRPHTATRIEIELRYMNEYSFEVTVRDKGFGDLFPASGFETTKQIDLTSEF